MALNPNTCRFEPATLNSLGTLVRPDGSDVPKTWTTFQLGELVVIKDSTFKVAYIGENAVLFETVQPLVINALQIPGR